MTQTADPARSPGTGTDRPSAPRPAMPVSGVAVCPYLLSADGTWRSAIPAREHRCAAVLPATPLAPDKQRRLCLTAAHRRCATFAAASSAHPGSDPTAAGAKVLRPYPRTTPVVFDHGRLQVSAPAITAGRGTGQFVLVSLLIVAFIAIAVARLAGGDQGGVVGGAVATDSPSPLVTASPSASPRATRTPPPPTPSPTALASVAASVAPTASPAPATPRPETPTRTYTVRAGDTLIGIASRFGTTAKVLMQLNGIDDARSLRIGAVLQIP